MEVGGRSDLSYIIDYIN